MKTQFVVYECRSHANTITIIKLTIASGSGRRSTATLD